MNRSFRRDANYSIIWERADWDIRSGDWGQAYFNGPKHTGPWYLDINPAMERSLGYATIHRAAMLYYYNNPLGIQTPLQDTWYRRRLKIGYFHRMAKEEIYGSAYHYQWPTFPQIKIYGAYSGGLRNTRGIFSTTIHELAHVSHRVLVGRRDYHNSHTIVVESWARGVQWALTRIIYPGYRGGGTIRPDYTQVVVDMVDSRIDDGTNNGASYPFDKVEGYTMQQIENALVGAFTWEQWKNNILNMYDNETEIYLEALFNYWN